MEELEPEIELLPLHFSEWNLAINKGKTEFVQITSDNYYRLQNKKLGSRLSTMDDIKYRIIQSNTAFHKMWKLWLSRKNTALSTRIRLYNACILPILSYNMGASAARDTQLEFFNRAHRRHLRHILRIYWPQRISNSILYEKNKQQTCKLRYQ
jgi:hypothetical protein